MKSFLREVLIELVSSSSKLILELLRPHGDFSTLEGLASNCSTIEMMSDADHQPEHVRVFRDAKGAPVYAVVVDVQEHIDARKPWIWPVYVTATFAALRCPTALLVIAPEPHVARWVLSPGTIGEERLSSLVKPIVVSYRDVPCVADAEVARRLPELALLSALSHPCAEVARAAGAGLGAMADRAQAMRYFAAVRAALPEPLRAELKPEWADAGACAGAKSEAKAKAEAKSEAEAEAEAEVEGEAEPGARGRARGGEGPGRSREGSRYLTAEAEMLHAVYLQRLGGLSRDDEMALGVAGCEVDSAMCSILALACAQDVDEAREALYETASEFLHGWHPSQLGRAERSAA